MRNSADQHKAIASCNKNAARYLLIFGAKESIFWLEIHGNYSEIRAAILVCTVQLLVDGSKWEEEVEN